MPFRAPHFGRGEQLLENTKFLELEEVLRKKLVLCKNSFSTSEYERFEDEVFDICGEMEMVVSKNAFAQSYLDGFRTAANSLARVLSREKNAAD